MQNNPQSDSPSESGQDDSRRYLARPIYELELVISGAVIVGLFQIPQLLDDAILGVLRHGSKQAQLMPSAFYILVQSALVGLISVFLMHLFLRCLWVGVIGLRSAFPQGIDWAKIDFGPVTKRFYRGRHIELSDVEARLDRVCSSLFSSLFLMLVGLMQAGFYILLIALISFGLRATVFPDVGLPKLFVVLYLVLFMPVLLLAAVVSQMDRRFRDRPEALEARPRLKRWIERGLRVLWVVNLSSIHQPIMLVFRSRVSGARYQAIVFGVMFVLMALSYSVVLVRLDAVRLESYVYLPSRAGALEASSAHYEDRREPLRHQLAPTISSEIIDEPYLRLFLPFDAEYGSALLVEQCPDLQPYRDEGLHLGPDTDQPHPERDRAVLDCVASLYDVRLNGEAVTPEYLFTRRESDGTRGLLAWLDASRLRSGLNRIEVDVLRHTLAEVEDDPNTRRSRQYFIPFIYAGERAIPSATDGVDPS
jgi:hypothetical protein